MPKCASLGGLKNGLVVGAVLSILCGSSYSSCAAWILDIDPEACRSLVDFVPDGSADYIPGLDVHGRPVIPAEGSAGSDISTYLLSDHISIELDSELAHRFGFFPKVHQKYHLGSITVKNKKVFLNGKPLGSSEENALHEACLRNEALRRAASSSKGN